MAIILEPKIMWAGPNAVIGGLLFGFGIVLDVYKRQGGGQPRGEDFIKDTVLQLVEGNILLV